MSSEDQANVHSTSPYEDSTSDICSKQWRIRYCLCSTVINFSFSPPSFSFSFIMLTLWIRYFIKHLLMLVCLIITIGFRDCGYGLNSPEEMFCFSQCIGIKRLMISIYMTSVDFNFNYSVKGITTRFLHCKIIISPL